MLKAIENTFNSNNVEFNVENQHVRCFAHVINLAVQKILQTLNAVNDIDLENNYKPNGKTANLLYKVSLYLNY